MAIITDNTKLLGVIGCPIQHSLSPVMHNAALQHRAQQLRQNKLDYVYVPLLIEPKHLGAAIAGGLAAVSWRGFNVTIPHKQAIMAYLSEMSSIAETVGAVNTVWREGDRWLGTNTDVQGFLAPLQTHPQDWTGRQVCILGAGGAARAVIVACQQLGFTQIHVVGRDRSKLLALQESFRQTSIPIELQLKTWDELATLLPQAHLLVNTTPVGMHPQEYLSPLTLETMALLPQGAVVYDLIYTPRPTHFLKDAAELGYTAIDGLEMLVQQGADALGIWLQETISVSVVSVMREAAEAQLQINP
jgi:shikimate dehydrogenase